MTDIRDYPNPLLKEFIKSVGGIFDPSGKHEYPNGKPSVAQLEAFINKALEDPENLQRLNLDGTVTKTSVKVLYEGQIGSVWNSALANDFANRAGSEVGTIDLTKLGQFVFRSDLEKIIKEEDEIDFKTLNEDLSKNFIEQNPVDKYKLFLPDEAWMADRVGKFSILRDIEMPTAIAQGPDHTVFEGPTKSELIEARGNATGDAAFESDYNQIRQAFFYDLRLNEPNLRQDTTDRDPVTNRVVLASMEISEESLAKKGLSGLSLSAVDPQIPLIGPVPKELAIREISFAKTLQDVIYRYADKIDKDFFTPFYEGTKTNFNRAVDELAKTLQFIDGKIDEGFDIVKASASQIWRKGLELSQSTANAGEDIVKSLARWGKAFTDEFSDIFDNLPEPLVGAGKNVLRYYREAWDETLGLFRFDGDYFAELFENVANDNNFETEKAA